MGTSSDFETRIQVIEDTFESLDYTDVSRMPDEKIVDMVTRVRNLADRVAALAAIVITTADTAKATDHTTGTPLGDFLAAAEGRTPSQGIGVVKRASKLAHHPDVRDAALAGIVSPDHATAIGEELGKLPQD